MGLKDFLSALIGRKKRRSDDIRYVGAGFTWNSDKHVTSGHVVEMPPTVNDMVESTPHSHPVEAPASLKNKFAVSDCVYLPGLICLEGCGRITYDPKSLGADSIIELRKAVGFEIVSFEGLLLELVELGIELNGPSLRNANKLPINEKYASECRDIGLQIANLLRELPAGAELTK